MAGPAPRSQQLPESRTSGRRGWIAAAVAAAACLGLALLTPAAPATISFPMPQTLSEGFYRGHDLAIDSSGRTTVVWARRDGSNYRVEAVRLGPDGTPGPVRSLSAAGEDAGYPRVAVRGSGRATVVWVRHDGTSDRIQSVQLGAAAGNPGPVETLSPPGGDAEGGQVAIDGTGRATVVWTRFDGVNDRVQSARIGADGTVGPVETLSEAGEDATLWPPPRFAQGEADQVAIDGSGRATVVWSRFDGANDRVQSTRIGAEGAFAPVKTLSEPGRDADLAALAVDGASRATVVWTELERIRSVRLGAAAGNPGAVNTLSEPGHEAGSGHIVIDSTGRAIVAWKEYFNEVGSGQIVRIGADGIPGEPQAWGGDGDKQIDIAVDGSDRPTITHGDEAGGVTVMRFAAAGAPVPVSEDPVDVGDGEGGSPLIAIDGSDRPTIAFEGEAFDPFRDIIQLARAEINYPETTITSGPSGPTTDDSPRFEFIDDLASTSFECSLDSGGWSACSSPLSYTNLADGPHSFAVRSVDLETDVDPTPAERSFTVTSIDGYAAAREVQPQGGKRIAVKVRVTAGEDLTAKARGAVRLEDDSYRLKPKAKRVPAGRSKKLRLKSIGRRASRAIVSALRQSVDVSARLRVKLIDEAGNSKIEKLTVRLER